VLLLQQQPTVLMLPLLLLLTAPQPCRKTHQQQQQLLLWRLLPEMAWVLKLGVPLRFGVLYIHYFLYLECW